MRLLNLCKVFHISLKRSEFIPVKLRGLLFCSSVKIYNSFVIYFKINRKTENCPVYSGFMKNFGAINFMEAPSFKID